MISTPVLRICIRCLSGILITIAFPLFEATAEEIAAIDSIVKTSTVYQWRASKCADLDIPDEPLRAFRRNDGIIIAFASHSVTRKFTISSDGTFHHDCAVVMESALNLDPAEFNYRTWIAATWTDDGKYVIALGDNEFHGQVVSGQCKFSTYLQCWYNAVVLLESHDSGNSFKRMPGPPVAAAAFDNRAFAGKPRGFFGPTNIFRHGAFHYALIYTPGGGDQKQGTCLFRAKDVSRVESWEYWTGSKFTRSAYNPFRETAGREPCQPVEGIPGRLSSVVWDERSQTFLGSMAVQGPDQSIGRIDIRSSKNLLKWTPLRAVMTVPMLWSKTCDHLNKIAYPSIIDLSSKSRNFEEIADNPYLYITEGVVNGCALTLERNLVRAKLNIHRAM